MTGWSFDVEILSIARRRGYSIEELPIHWYYSEQSHISPLKDSFRMIADLIRIRRDTRSGKYGEEN